MTGRPSLACRPARDSRAAFCSRGGLVLRGNEIDMTYFADIKKIAFEGPNTRNDLAFHHYDADAVIEGKTMRDHLRFSVVYWHTFRGTGADPFGAPTMQRPWDDGTESLENAIQRV